MKKGGGGKQRVNLNVKNRANPPRTKKKKDGKSIVNKRRSRPEEKGKRTRPDRTKVHGDKPKSGSQDEEI